MRADLVLVEQVRLGVQEALVVEPDLHLVGAQEGDQVLDQPERLGRERLGFEVALEPGLERLGVGSEADVGPGVRLGAEQQPEGPELVQPVLDEPVARDGEVGRGDVERPADAAVEQRFSASARRC